MQELKCSNKVDDLSGSVEGNGIKINWQNGPLGLGAKRILPNGAFVEGVIQAVIQRLQFFQLSKFNCEENKTAILNLQLALQALNQRTSSRQSRSVEGTHQK